MYRKQHLLCKRGEFNVVFVITKCLCLSSQTFGALNLFYPPFSPKPCKINGKVYQSTVTWLSAQNKP